MIINLSKILLFLFILNFVFLGCKKSPSLEKEMIPNEPANPNFFIDVEVSSWVSDHLLLITNQNNEVLFEKIGPEEIDNQIQIEKKENEQINVTYGLEYSTERGFRLETFRDVPSGFKISNRVPACGNEFKRDFSFDLKSVEIHLNGITDYEKIHYPLNQRDDITIDVSNNKLILKGQMRDEIDFLLTVFPNSNENPKCMVFNLEDWTSVTPDSLFKEVNFMDFQAAEIHPIQLPFEGSFWAVESEILTADNQVIVTQGFTSYQDYFQFTDEVALYLPTEQSMKKLNLMVGNLNLVEGYKYHKIIENIPTEINFYAPTMNLDGANIHNFNVSIDGNYDLAHIEYLYGYDNFLSSWSIYQKNDLALNFEKPELPSVFIENTNVIKEVINTPRDFILHAYKSDKDAFSYEDNFLRLQLYCNGVDERYQNIEF